MPIAALIALQSTVVAIKQGCQMLSEGRAEISKLKKTVEQGVGDAKAIYKDITGLWSWLKGLFGFNTAPAAKIAPPPVAEPPKKSKKVSEPELTYEEYQTRAVHQVCEHLKTFFEIRRQLMDHCHKLEEESKTTLKIEDSAIDRVQIEMQLENMTVQIREAMVYAPKELKDIYGRFLKMYDQIMEEQEFARQLKRKQDRDAKWQQELLRNHRIDRAVVLAVVILAVLWMWAMLLSLGWLGKTPDGLSLP
jgi:hypothetical protein